MKMTLKQLGIKKKEYIGKDEDDPVKKTSHRKNLKNTHLFDRGKKLIMTCSDGRERSQQNHQ